MGIGIFLLAFGLTALVGGGWVALNLRGSAASLERRAAANAELRMQAQGNLGPAPMHVSRGLYRTLGAVIALAGSVLALGGLLELAS
ncbi:hypothetical protein ACFY04_30115 [Streptomyces sp. NPDC001549]|uniref:hypothetical protein n=1 Tax=Streptomyces sp. NPDC001549 TaxID=3364586 RepID=UPI0036B625C3